MDGRTDGRNKPIKLKITLFLVFQTSCNLWQTWRTTIQANQDFMFFYSMKIKCKKLIRSTSLIIHNILQLRIDLQKNTACIFSRFQIKEAYLVLLDILCKYLCVQSGQLKISLVGESQDMHGYHNLPRIVRDSPTHREKNLIWIEF